MKRKFIQRLEYITYDLKNPDGEIKKEYYFTKLIGIYVVYHHLLECYCIRILVNKPGPLGNDMPGVFYLLENNECVDWTIMALKGQSIEMNYRNTTEKKMLNLALSLSLDDINDLIKKAHLIQSISEFYKLLKY